MTEIIQKANEENLLKKNEDQIIEVIEPSENLAPPLSPVEKENTPGPDSEIKYSHEQAKNPSPVSFRNKQEVSFMVQPDEDKASHISSIKNHPQEGGNSHNF